MRANKKEAPILLAQNGPLRGMNWVVNRHLTIGRDDDCDIVIPDRQVSRFHAEVTLNENGDFMLSDLKSKNGTTLNGELLLEKEKLKEGDEIKIALAQEFLFVSSRGKAISRVTVFHYIRKYAEAAGIQKEISPHTFRHSFATHLLERGANIRVIQEMLGHEKITTTEIYTRIDRNFLRQEIIEHHPRNKK